MNSNWLVTDESRQKKQAAEEMKNSDDVLTQTTFTKRQWDQENQDWQSWSASWYVYISSWLINDWCTYSNSSFSQHSISKMSWWQTSAIVLNTNFTSAIDENDASNSESSTLRYESDTSCWSFFN